MSRAGVWQAPSFGARPFRYARRAVVLAEEGLGMRGSKTPDPGGRTTERHAADPARHASGRRPRRRTLLLGAVAVVLAIVGWGAWLAHDALQARKELVAAADLLTGLQSDVLAGAPDVSATLSQVQAHAAAALEATHGPQWSAAAAVPWVGDNVRAVQAVSEVVDTLALDVLPNLVDVAAVVDPSALAPTEGRVDLAPLQQAAPVVVAAAEQVAEGQRRLDGIDADSLWAVVASPLVDLRGKLDQLAMTTATASRSVQLLPPMLGAEGPRTYLVLVQNPAEPRATGGVPALVLLRADAGTITLVEQRSAGVGDQKEPALPLTREEKSLFSDLVGAYMGDVTFTPDFPRSAELARALWEQEIGGPIDGVLSVEPGAIAAMLGASGPVSLANGVQLTGDNAAQWLMNTVYLDYSSDAERDAMFAQATAAAFAALAGGQWEPTQMMGALSRSAREGRLMAWSAHPEEQALLSGTVLSGELTGVLGDSPVIGVYFNDGSQSKMGYYLQADVAATTSACLADGSQRVTVRLSLTSVAPSDAATLPSYISGGRVLPPGQMRTNVLLYAPQGGRIDDVRVEGAEPGVHSQVHDGLAVVGKTITLSPGQAVVLEYDVLTGTHQEGVPVLRVTPLARHTVAVNGATC